MSKKEILMTPKGRANWVKIFNPDTKFNPEGDYSVTMVYQQDEAQELMSYLDKQLEASINSALKEKKTTRAKLRTQAPYEIDEETGEVSVKFKLKAQGKTRDGVIFTQKPAVFDSKRAPITDEIDLWNGSILRVGYQPIGYFTSLVGAGVSLRLKQVQVINAVSGGAAEAVFDEEDGYTFDEDDVVTTTDSETDYDSEDIPF